MRRILTALVLLGLAAGADAGAAEPQRLTSGGQPVDFALWSPVTPSHSYQDLALSPERRRAFEEAGNDFVYRLYRSEIHLQADGNVVETETTVGALLTRSAVRNYGDDYAWVDAYSDTLTIEQAYSLLPGGERIPVDPATVQATLEESYRIFSDYFTITVPYGGLVPEAMTVLVVRTEHDGQAFPLPWSRSLRPQTPHPMERFEARVTWDEGVTPPDWHSDLPELSCRSPEPRTLICEASELPPFEGDPEINYKDRIPTLVIAEPVTWAELVRQEQALFETALEPDPALDATADRLVRDAPDAEARVAAIHGFVTQQVRYLGLEHGLGGIIPRPTHLTLSRRFGDCKDKTALFVDLARRAGLSAYAVLTSTQRSNLDKLMLPASTYFNHMIACVRLPGAAGGPEREICVDLTDPYSSHDVLSRGAQGAVRLDIRPGTEAPGQLPAEDYGWLLTIGSEHRMTPEGGLKSEVTRSFGGLNAAWLRARLQDRNREERQEWLREDYYDNHKDEVELISATAEGVDELTAEVRVETSSFLEDSFDPEDLTYFWDWESELQDEVEAFTTGNEKHPYQFPGLRVLSTSRYVLPPEHHVTNHGAQTDFVSEFGRFTVSYETEAEGVRITTELSMPRALISNQSIPRFNDFIKHVGDHAKIRFEIARN